MKPATEYDLTVNKNRETFYRKKVKVEVDPILIKGVA